MNTKYGIVPDCSVVSNMNDLIGQIFKLLPYKENQDTRLDECFSSILYRLTGMCNIMPDQPALITVLSILESARIQDDFKMYRKAILDSCSTLKRLKESINV